MQSNFIGGIPWGCALLIGMAAVALAADPDVATLRSTALGESDEAPRMMPQSNTDLRKARNYPEQPPVIPHKIEGYQVDINVNKCLTCHSRRAVEDSQAPMVSITHFMDRDGQFLASISPRRYFCNQCHVPQHEVKPLVGNSFVDVDDMIGER
ncbi:MAG: nitrate reductase cytochrome c-type subunit [Geminicoccaceae bacterium]